MKSFRKLAIDATLLGTVALALLLPAFAQQEMDPTWYDPWAKPAAHVTKVAATNANKPRKIKLVSQDRPKNKKVFQPEATERAALVRK
jgi:hypothetical protein